MEDVLEYELLDIEWELNYEFYLESPGRMVRDTTGDKEENHEPSLVYDENGIPMGESPEDIKIREKIIFGFYEQWKNTHPEKSVFNSFLKSDILIRKESVVEAAVHAAKKYKSTLAVFKLDELLAGAVGIDVDQPKPGNKNQSKLTRMIVMIYRIEGIGRIKLTVGVRRRSGDKIQYGISAIADNVPIQAIVKNKHTKKAPHKK